jgi:hypothetical protein
MAGFKTMRKLFSAQVYRAKNIFYYKLPFQEHGGQVLDGLIMATIENCQVKHTE